MPKITYPANFEFLDEIRDFVAGVARQGGGSLRTGDLVTGRRRHRSRLREILRHDGRSGG